MLNLSDVGLRRNEWVLRNIDLELKEGEIYGIIGKSGAGKTTLLKIMAGLLDATEGEIAFQDEAIIGPSGKLIPGYDEIQLVNQDFALALFSTVEENIRTKILSRHDNDQEELLQEVLTLVELEHLKDQKAHLISGGEQQRLALAMALACESKVLLLDEPFVHIDQRLRWKIMNYLIELNNTMRTTVVLVSHDGAEMMGFVNEIIYINKSMIKRKASTKEVYYNPGDREEAELLGQVNEVNLDGMVILFRPNEYSINEDSKIEVEFLYAIDTGLNCFNYFELLSGGKIMLVNKNEMKSVKRITISKRI